MTLGVAALYAWAFTGEIPGGPEQGTAAPRARLEVFLHPRCPCSKATVEQLAALAPRLPERADVTVWMVRAAPGQHSELAERAAAIPGVTVAYDTDGAAADAEGADLSGHAVWYAADGRVRFRGGLTAERGHAGESAGTDAIEALMAEAEPAAARAPVFGCELAEVQR